MEFLWWHWAVIGFGCILSELLLPMFVLVWFGIGGLAVSLALFLSPDMLLEYQLLLWVGVSLVFVALWFKVFKRGYHAQNMVGSSSAQFVGQVGIITEAVAPFRNGKVRFQKPMLGSETWECVASEAIDVGTRVRVAQVDGSRMTVDRV